MVRKGRAGAAKMSKGADGANRMEDSVKDDVNAQPRSRPGGHPGREAQNRALAAEFTPDEIRRLTKARHFIKKAQRRVADVSRELHLKSNTRESSCAGEITWSLRSC